MDACSNNNVIGSDFRDCCMRSSQVIYVPRLVCGREINKIICLLCFDAFDSQNVLYFIFFVRTWKNDERWKKRFFFVCNFPFLLQSNVNNSALYACTFVRTHLAIKNYHQQSA